jgi:hypothetical protein
MMFWKEAWLRPVSPAEGAMGAEVDLPLSGLLHKLPVRDGELYLCQSTALLNATKPLSGSGFLDLLRDVSRGELSIGRFAEIIARVLLNGLRSRLGMREIGALRGAHPTVPDPLNLRAGEQVRIKATGDIAATLDKEGKTRGLTFEPEMTPYAGGVYTVDTSVVRMIHEGSGRMVMLKSTVVLKGVDCQGRCTRNCPRSNPLFWREAWLERAKGA